MEILLNNPLTNLDSSTFQLVYICLIAALLIIGRLGLRSLDETAARPALPSPRQPNPYELAHLRGGLREVTRTAIFSLVERGYLQVRPSDLPTLVQANQPPALGLLLPLESAIFNHFTTPVTAAEIFQANSPLLAQVKLHCTPFEDILHKKELLVSSEMKLKAWGNIVLLGLIIIIFGGYWVYAANANGRGGSLMVVLLGLVGLALVVYLCRLPRLSERGRLYFKQLQTDFYALQVRPTEATAGPAGPYSNLTVAVSLFGSSVLSGTVYSPFQQMFQEPDSASGSDGGGVSRWWQRLVRR